MYNLNCHWILEDDIWWFLSMNWYAWIFICLVIYLFIQSCSHSHLIGFCIIYDCRGRTVTNGVRTFSPIRLPTYISFYVGNLIKDWFIPLICEYIFGQPYSICYLFFFFFFSFFSNDCLHRRNWLEEKPENLYEQSKWNIRVS